MTVTAPGVGVPLTVRPGTSDMCVFDDIFAHQEYGWTFGAPPRVIVDAGAYIGLSTVYFADRYPDATIIAIEPDAENFELLTLNTARFPNVHAVRAAAWVTSGSISLRDPGYGPWGVQVTGAEPGAEHVRAMTIDEIMREFNLDKIDLLKMDVEGSEKEIFADAGAWLSSVDAICIELHDRLKNGCSSSFFEAVGDFPIQLRRREDILVARPESRLNPIS
jgi:FkbM family methyltransferase